MLCAPTPLLDLANLAGMNGFDGGERRALLAAYRRAEPTGAELAELTWLDSHGAAHGVVLGSARGGACATSVAVRAVPRASSVRTLRQE